MSRREIHIDVSLIPDYTRDVLADAAWEFYQRLRQMPGGQAMIDAKKAELKKAKVG